MLQCLSFDNALEHSMLPYSDDPPSIGYVLQLELSCLASLSPPRNSIINIGTSIAMATLTSGK